TLYTNRNDYPIKFFFDLSSEIQWLHVLEYLKKIRILLLFKNGWNLNIRHVI
ncbi:hypothetical protein PanWU01x14_271460, partial [Parasponia andersonii]